MFDKYVGRLLAIRDAAHIAHLNTTNYAEHKALNKFYDDYLDIFDDLAEAMMAEYGRKVNRTIAFSIKPTQSAKDIIEDCHNTLMELRGKVECPGIQNIIDDGLRLCKKTKYMLTLS